MEHIGVGSTWPSQFSGRKQSQGGKNKLLEASNGFGVEVNAEMANCVYGYRIRLVTRTQDEIKK
jgi:hypothetical protein